MQVEQPQHRGKTRLLIVTPDYVGPRMAGIALRHWEFARALSKEFPVTLMTDDPAEVEPEGFQIAVPKSGEEVAALVGWSDVILVQGDRLSMYPMLKEAGKPLIVDLICPNHLEELERVRIAGSSSPSSDPSFEHYLQHSLVLDRNCDQLLIGDFFICGGDVQKDFWLGMLSALNRINPYTYNGDQAMDGLVKVVPFGIPSQPPEHTGQVLKGVWKGIRKDDIVLLWNGGIWDWFDPLTVVHAVSHLSKERDDIKLVFMGVRHPRPGAPFPRMAEKAVELAQALGAYGTSIFFTESWVPYEARGNYLLEADIGINCQMDHLETRFAFRTRVLDYLWAGLPIISSRGDCLSRDIERHEMGQVVEVSDVAGWEKAILAMTSRELRDRCSANVREYAEDLHWEQVVRPIAEFCRHPRLAPDKMAPRTLSQAAVERQRAKKLEQERDEAVLRVQAMKQELARAGGEIESLRQVKDELQGDMDRIRRTLLYRFLHTEVRDLKEAFLRFGRRSRRRRI